MAKMTLPLLIAIFFISTSFCQSKFSFPDNQQAELYMTDSELVEKLVLAVIGAILGFMSAYLLARRKEKREAKELSYELVIKDAITKEESPIKENIGLIYRNKTVPNLAFVSCTVKNTGNVLVKDEEIRFEFKDDKNLDILDHYFDPKPEPELRVTEEISGDLKSFERKYKIGHLVKGKEVKFNFVVSASNPALKLHDFNPTGDVEFNETSINKRKSQQEVIRQFVFINLILYVLHPLVSIGDRLDFILEIVWSIAFVAFNISFIKPVAGIVSEFIIRWSKPNGESSLEVDGNNNIIIKASGGGIADIRDINLRTENAEKSTQ